MTKDEMVGWNHQLGRHEFELVMDREGGLVSCGPWGLKESDTTELN